MAELEHIGIAVEDIEATLRLLEDVLQVSPYKSESIEKDRIRTHFVRGGGAKLELLESLDPSSPVARFIEKRGPGLHHLAFEVTDIDAAHGRAADAGYKPLDDAPRPGADGKRIFFLHPKDTAGILIEFCESERSVLGDASRSGDLHVRRSSSSTGIPIVYLHGSSPDPRPDDLARRLEQRFQFRSVEAPGGLEPDTLLDATGDAAGLIASANLVPAALSLAAESDLKALVLVHPPDRLWPVELTCPVLIVGRDRAGFNAALEARASNPGSALAIVPDDDTRLVTVVIERHLAKALGADH